MGVPPNGLYMDGFEWKIPSQNGWWLGNHHLGWRECSSSLWRLKQWTINSGQYFRTKVLLCRTALFWTWEWQLAKVEETLPSVTHWYAYMKHNAGRSWVKNVFPNFVLADPMCMLILDASIRRFERYPKLFEYHLVWVLNECDSSCFIFESHPWEEATSAAQGSVSSLNPQPNFWLHLDYEIEAAKTSVCLKIRYRQADWIFTYMDVSKNGIPLNIIQNETFLVLEPMVTWGFSILRNPQMCIID